jgi:Flp pilus assembly protein TadG
MFSFKQVKHRIGQFWSDKNAAVLPFFAFGLVALATAVGLATDTGLGFLMKARMGKALDAAGLAAGRVKPGGDIAAEALAFFQANFPSGSLNATVTNFSVTPSTDTQFITLNATVEFPTTFMRVAGIETSSVSVRTVIHRQTRGMELALVMDNTGSMRSGGKINAMKSAAQSLVDVLYGGQDSQPNFWVSLVPYTATVNVCSNHFDWLDPGDRYYDIPDPFVPSAWKGCMEARAAPLDQDDTVPSSVPFASYYYASGVDNNWPPLNETNGAQNNGTGPNLGCGPAITPLVKSKTVVDAAITEMLPWSRGGTTSNLGLVWGWRVLSPEWRGLWDDPELPHDYETQGLDKVVIVLTDGQNQFYDWKGHSPNGGVGPSGSDYTAYGRLNDFGFFTLNQARAEIDTRFSNICTAMKDEGILIYAITFGNTPNDDTQDLYRDCATQPSYYKHAPDNDDLQTVFQEISEQLSNLRIAE